MCTSSAWHAPSPRRAHQVLHDCGLAFVELMSPVASAQAVGLLSSTPFAVHDTRAAGAGVVAL